MLSPKKTNKSDESYGDIIDNVVINSKTSKLRKKNFDKTKNNIHYNDNLPF